MRLVITTVMTIYLTFLTNQALAQSNHRLEVASIGAAAFPPGQTNKAPAVVYVSGIFPNGCFHWLGAEVGRVAPSVYTVKGYVDVFQGFCTMALVPFIQEISLGYLPMGNYVFRFYQDQTKYFEKTVQITEGL